MGAGQEAIWEPDVNRPGDLAQGFGNILHVLAAFAIIVGPQNDVLIPQ